MNPWEKFICKSEIFQIMFHYFLLLKSVIILIRGNTGDTKSPNGLGYYHHCHEISSTFLKGPIFYIKKNDV